MACLLVSKNSSNINCITTTTIARARHSTCMMSLMPAVGVEGRADCLGCRSGQQAASSYCLSGMESWAESGLISKLIPSQGWPASDWVMWGYEGPVIAAQLGTPLQAIVAEKLPVGSAEAVVRAASQPHVSLCPPPLLPFPSGEVNSKGMP